MPNENYLKKYPDRHVSDRFSIAFPYVHALKEEPRTCLSPSTLTSAMPPRSPRPTGGHRLISADLPNARVPFTDREGRNRSDMHSHPPGNDVLGFNIQVPQPQAFTRTCIGVSQQGPISKGRPRTEPGPESTNTTPDPTSLPPHTLDPEPSGSNPGPRPQTRTPFQHERLLSGPNFLQKTNTHRSLAQRSAHVSERLGRWHPPSGQGPGWPPPPSSKHPFGQGLRRPSPPPAPAPHQTHLPGRDRQLGTLVPTCPLCWSETPKRPPYRF